MVSHLQVDSIDFALFQTSILIAVDKALEETARLHPYDVQARIFGRLTPSGGPQRANAPSTVRRKGHDTPLFDRGRLSDPSAYTVRPGDLSGRTHVTIASVPLAWIVEPPLDREDAIMGVRARGYEVFDISAELVDTMRLKITDALEQVGQEFGV